MLIADTSLAFDPAYPWSIPTIGPVSMFVVAVLLAALTVASYLGLPQATWRRLLVLVAIRLAALAVTFSILLRPSLAFTQLEGIEGSKLLVIVDASASMSVSEGEGKPTRWRQVQDVLKSSSVERRLKQLAQYEKIDVVKYLGDADLRSDDPEAQPKGARTDVGAWLHDLFLKHGQEKHLQGIALFSDGSDNGTQFSATEKARRWRGIAPIHAFGVGDPQNARFKKDLALTRLDVNPERIFVKSAFSIDAVLQAPGFEKADIEGTVTIENLATEKEIKLADLERRKVEQEKDQKIRIAAIAPEEPGEYKVTLKITPHEEEVNKENNQISTYIHVVKEKVNILWVDRRRVYEPVRILQRALAPEEQLLIHFVELLPGTAGDPAALYEFDKRHYDAVIIGDVSAKQFSLGNDRVFDRIGEMVRLKKMGLLLLGGSETFAKGGWDKVPALLKILPVDFDMQGKKPEFSAVPVQAAPTPAGLQEKFGRLHPDPKVNARIWAEEFDPLKGIAPVGRVRSTSTVLLKGENDEPVLVATRSGDARIAVFAGDSTAESWFVSEDSVKGFTHFWKHLIFWIANQEKQSDALTVALDKRRLLAGGTDVLNFTVALRDKAGNAVPGGAFKAKVIQKGGQEEQPVRVVGNRGTFQGAKEPGEYQLVVEASAKETGNVKATARFLVVADDVELLRPLANHETLQRIATASEGQFHLASEAAFLKFLDDRAAQIGREARHRTTHWPDWKRIPASEGFREQASGIWNSFALVSLLAFVALLGGEWFLRRTWGFA